MSAVCVKHEGRVSKNLDYLCEVNDVILFYDKYQELWKINVKIKMFKIFFKVR